MLPPDNEGGGGGLTLLLLIYILCTLILTHAEGYKVFLLENPSAAVQETIRIESKSISIPSSTSNIIITCIRLKTIGKSNIFLNYELLQKQCLMIFPFWFTTVNPERLFLKFMLPYAHMKSM